jgi:hypothetical protein
MPALCSTRHSAICTRPICNRPSRHACTTTSTSPYNVWTVRSTGYRVTKGNPDGIKLDQAGQHLPVRLSEYASPVGRRICGSCCTAFRTYAVRPKHVNNKSCRAATREQKPVAASQLPGPHAGAAYMHGLDASPNLSPESRRCLSAGCHAHPTYE